MDFSSLRLDDPLINFDVCALLGALRWLLFRTVTSPVQIASRVLGRIGAPELCSRGFRRESGFLGQPEGDLQIGNSKLRPNDLSKSIPRQMDRSSCRITTQVWREVCGVGRLKTAGLWTARQAVTTAPSA